MSDVKLPDGVAKFAERFGQSHHDEIVSIIFSPQPFTPGELYLICSSESPTIVGLTVETYADSVLNVARFCVRRSQLWELAAGHWFVPSGGTYFPNPSYALRGCGVVLYGADLRKEIPLPAKPEVTLLAQIEGCRFYVRNHQVLKRLTRGDFEGLFESLSRQFAFLMASATVVRTGEGFLESQLEELFAAAYASTRAARIQKEFASLRTDTEPDLASARRAVWLFERFMRALIEEVSDE